ncbi:RusA family crossover junction endodeoxyribonuclease [Sphingomonas rubra]|nr:RusA family crossover junction endodeoxyribonuclease [Sphingomonas rubra]
MDDVAVPLETQFASLFPLEFHLTGVPLSLQAKASSKERWKSTIAEAARRRAEDTVDLVWLEDTPLAVTIFYFPTAPMAGDVDNIVKPILDALNGQAYLDDQVVERIVSQKFEPDTDWSFGAPTGQLAAALDTISAAGERQPVVYIRIDDDLSWRTQP